MTTLRKITDNKKHAEEGDAKPVKKTGGLTIGFLGQRFSQTFPDSFFEHTKEEKIIDRFVEIYSGAQANITESSNQLGRWQENP